MAAILRAAVHTYGNNEVSAREWMGAYHCMANRWSSWFDRCMKGVGTLNDVDILLGFIGPQIRVAVSDVVAGYTKVVFSSSPGFLRHTSDCAWRAAFRRKRHAGVLDHEGLHQVVEIVRCAAERGNTKSRFDVNVVLFLARSLPFARYVAQHLFFLFLFKRQCKVALDM